MAKATPATKPPTKTEFPPNAASKAAQAAAHQKRPEQHSVQVAHTNPPSSVVEQKARPEPTSLPEFMRKDADAGKENISQDDLEIPRLKLMQGVSPELTEFDDLRAGNFFHPAAEHIFDSPFRAVPVYMDKQYILWKPREMGGGILARCTDGINWSPSQGEFKVKLDRKDGGANVTWKLAATVAQSGLANWGSQNPDDPDSPPAATLMYNFVLAFPDEPDLMPAVLSFQRTSVKSGRRFVTKLKTQRAPIYGTIWEFSPVEENRNNQSFYTIGVKGAGLVQDVELYNQYKTMNQQFSAKGVNIKDVEGLQDDDPTEMDAGDNDLVDPKATGHKRF